MAKLDNLIKAQDDLIEEALKKFKSGYSGVEKELYNLVSGIFAKATVNAGKIQNTATMRTALLQMEEKIREALKKMGYDKKVNDLLLSFDDISDNIAKVQSEVNAVDISDIKISAIKELEVSAATDRLLGTGISSEFIIPMRTALYRHIALGGQITTAQGIIQDYLQSHPDAPSKLSRYVTQVSRDTVNQFDGSINAKISQELGFDGYIYAGSIKENSRPQCERWVDMRIIPNEILQDEINWAINYGSGMIEWTTPETFAIYRGGYNCRHRAIPTLTPKEG
jgi:malonyl CoA-acyl carrier protein transacylase